MDNVIEVLQARGFIEQITGEELKERCKKPIRLYLGIDPTADSLHLGNLMGLVALAWFQKLGHNPYALVGGATGRIGDPSGKSKERPILDDATLKHNVQSLEKSLHKMLRFSEGNRAVIVNNDDWLGPFSLIQFLRDVGKQFRVGQMLAKESVRSRIQSEEGMSFTEFSYQVLQGYDFYHLHKTEKVCLQIGGSDQWGNITAGIELNRKMGEEPVYGMIWPLLTRSDGKKFGKSEGGAIWLSADKLSPYEFYQYLFRIPDADVIRMLRLLTFVDLEEILEIEADMQKKSYVPNTAQKRLAAEVTRFVHGDEGVEAAEKVSRGVGFGSDAKLSAKVLKQLAADMPNMTLPSHDVLGQKFVDLACKVGLIPSKAEAVRLIKNGGAYFNNERVVDPAFVFGKEHLIEGEYLLLSVGKKKRILITIHPMEKF
ncbi:MAG: tyrosine--tRNA ligase [Chlamydiia bacterium]|nr:tyrosine--tRNA ligase [Chlamydiia bacterium]